MPRLNAFIVAISVLAVFGIGMIAFEHMPRHGGTFPVCPASILQPANCPNGNSAGALSFHMNAYRTFAVAPFLDAALLAFALFFLSMAFPERMRASLSRITPLNHALANEGERTAMLSRRALRRWIARKKNGPNRLF